MIDRDAGLNAQRSPGASSVPCVTSVASANAPDPKKGNQEMNNRRPQPNLFRELKSALEERPSLHFQSTVSEKRQLRKH